MRRSSRGIALRPAASPPVLLLHQPLQELGQCGRLAVVQFHQPHYAVPAAAQRWAFRTPGSVSATGSRRSPARCLAAAAAGDRPPQPRSSTRRLPPPAAPGSRRANSAPTRAAGGGGQPIANIRRKFRLHGLARRDDSMAHCRVFASSGERSKQSRGRSPEPPRRSAGQSDFTTRLSRFAFVLGFRFSRAWTTPGGSPGVPSCPDRPQAAGHCGRRFMSSLWRRRPGRGPACEPASQFLFGLLANEIVRLAGDSISRGFERPTAQRGGTTATAEPIKAGRTRM